MSIIERNSKRKKAMLKEQNVCMLDVEGSVVYKDLVQADEEWKKAEWWWGQVKEFRVSFWLCGC